MSDAKEGQNRIILGDPVPWFAAPLVTGGSFDLHVFGGRWVVLAFLGSPADPRVDQKIAELRRDQDLFDEDRIIVRGVLTAAPSHVAKYAADGTKAISFVADYDGAISRAYGAFNSPRTIVLDPMLRAVADIPWDFAQGHAATARHPARPTSDRRLGRRTDACAGADRPTRL